MPAVHNPDPPIKTFLVNRGNRLIISVQRLLFQVVLGIDGSLYQNVSILGFIGAKDDGNDGENWSYNRPKTCAAPVISPQQHTSSTPILFTGRMPLMSLSSNHQCQNTEGKWRTPTSAGFARGVGGFDPQDKSLTPPAKVGHMYWGVVNWPPRKPPRGFVHCWCYWC